MLDANTSFSPVVKTSLGLIEGCYKAGMAVFKGLPYAAPPQGKLRWQPPHPALAWNGLRPALHFGASAPQSPSQAARFKEFVVEGQQSEDCLFLNIWTPRPDSQKRPVMVWIHGGLFTMGSGSQSVFDGTRLAANQDVVVVTINYRLGLLGFLNLNEITGGQIPARGNEGLLDIIAALQWLRTNIAEFGGNPNNITLFGESAGGTAIECLLCMPAAHGLFQRAIMQSNIQRLCTLKDAVAGAHLLIQELGLSHSDLNRLMAVPCAEIISVQKKLSSVGKSRGYDPAPVIDGVDLPAHPLEVFRAGSEEPVPLIIGTNREETRLFQALRPGPGVDNTKLVKEVARLLPAQNPQTVIAAYRTRQEEQGLAANPLDLLVAIQTDISFRQAAFELIDARTRHLSITFVYQFNWQSPALSGILGACHALEIGFVFGNHDAGFCGAGPMADDLSRRLQQSWAAFARHGFPSSPDMGPWPSYSDNNFIKMIG